LTALLTVASVAEMLGYSRSTILRWTDDGKLPGFRMPDGQLRYREDAITAWLEERATPHAEGSVAILAEAPPTR
jgi:excisionase family DNA binding protein